MSHPTKKITQLSPTKKNTDLHYLDRIMKGTGALLFVDSKEQLGRIKTSPDRSDIIIIPSAEKCSSDSEPVLPKISNIDGGFGLPKKLRMIF